MTDLQEKPGVFPVFVLEGGGAEVAFGINKVMERISNIILRGRNTALTEKEFYELEIGR